MIPSDIYDRLISQFPYKDVLRVFLNIDIFAIINQTLKENNLFINELYQDYFKRDNEIKKDFIRNLHL